MPGLTILQIEDAVEAPAVLQLLHRSAHPGKLIDEVPGEAAANIEAGISAVSCRVGAVRGLRLVGFEILGIAGIVDGVRPDKVGWSRSTRANRWCVSWLVANGSWSWPTISPGSGRRNSAQPCAARRNPKDSRHRLLVRNASQVGSCDLRLTGLIDIQELEQLDADRPHITNLQHCLAAQLLLEVQIEVLDVRRAQCADRCRRNLPREPNPE